MQQALALWSRLFRSPCHCTSVGRLAAEERTAESAKMAKKAAAGKQGSEQANKQTSGKERHLVGDCRIFCNESTIDKGG